MELTKTASSSDDDNYCEYDDDGEDDDNKTDRDHQGVVTGRCNEHNNNDTSHVSTNMAISETKGQGWTATPTQ